MTSPQRPPRLPRRALHGVLLLDKPLGWTSNDALQKVKHLLRAEKAGHTGTLDPLATGLLPLCFGAATKFSQVSLDADKTYRATLKLGVKTLTGDAEGEVCERRDVRFSEQDLQAARLQLLGRIRQVPPMHSALKKDGKALYDYARAGLTVEREARDVTVHRLDILAWQADEMHLETCVSKGTYIRTLAEDLGELLGCGAHLTALRRVQSGPVQVQDAVTLEAFMAMEAAERDACLLPPDVLIADWPRVDLAADDAGRFLSGLRRRVALADADAVRVYGPDHGALLGAAHIRAGELIPSRLLSPVEVQGVMSPPPTLTAPGLPSFQ
jgi:tRNA pseudouridine55 synthase